MGADGPTIGLVLTGIAALMTTFAAISYAGLLPRNRIMGLRTSDTLRSEVAWKAAQRAFGPWMLAGAGVTLITGLVLVIVDPAGTASERTAAVGLVVAVAVILVGGGRGGRAAGSAHRTDLLGEGDST